MQSETNLIYIGLGANQSDPENAVTIGTCLHRRFRCREWERHMSIVWTFELPNIKSKRAWDRWEDQHLTPWIDCWLERTRVPMDGQEMLPLGCKGRGRNWWLLSIDLDELIAAIMEKYGRDHK